MHNESLFLSLIPQHVTDCVEAPKMNRAKSLLSGCSQGRKGNTQIISMKYAIFIMAIDRKVYEHRERRI